MSQKCLNVRQKLGTRNTLSLCLCSKVTVYMWKCQWFLAVRRQPYKSWCPPQKKEKEEGQNFKSILSLIIKRKLVQDVNRMSENNISVFQYVNMSICQHVSMSICQYVRMQLFSLVIKMKVVQNVKIISENGMSTCQYVNMSVCQYVDMSECNFSV